MPAVLLDTLLQAANRGPAALRGHVKNSQDWYRNQAKSMAVSANQLLGGRGGELVSSPGVGHLYLFQYDPKLKLKLPYYDRFPLVLPYTLAPGGFMGLNLHYLPPQPRAALLDALLSTVTNDKLDESTKFKVSYSTLKGASKFRYFAPCLKHYLLDHVQSRFLHIAPKFWNLAVFLPLASFEKQSQSAVWRKSMA